VVSQKLKLALLQDILSEYSQSKCIVYFSSAAAVEYFCALFKKLNLLRSSVAPLHGKLSTKLRKAQYSTFENSSAGVLFTTDLAARGLDFDDVELVVQFDAPLDVKAFAHRAGRAARAGRSGRSVIFLVPKEEGYVDLLRLRKTPVTEWNRDLELEANAADIRQNIRELMQKQKDLFDLGIKAFVSDVQAYSKHHASAIFRVQDLDFGQLAFVFGLLRLPAMPELRQRAIEFDEMAVPWEQPTKKRKLVQTKPWSDKADRKERKEQRRSKKKLKRNLATPTIPERDSSEEERDWKELLQEKKQQKKASASLIGIE